jgi:L-ribulokinase
MAQPNVVTVEPDPEAVETYRALYEEYRRLHDLFGRGGDDVLRTLKQIKAAALAGSAVSVAALALRTDL